MGRPRFPPLGCFLFAALWLMNCASAPPPPPKGRVFSVPAGNLEPGDCQLRITYEGGLEALGDLNAIAFAIDGTQIMQARTKEEVDARRSVDKTIVHLGEVSIKSGVHRIDVGFQHLGKWVYQGYVFNISSAETFDCGEGLAKVSVKGTAPFKMTAESWSSAKAQFAWDGPAKAVPGASPDPL